MSHATRKTPVYTVRLVINIGITESYMTNHSVYTGLNSFSVDGALHIIRYAHDAVYRPFPRGIPPSTEKKLLQSFLNITFL